MNLTDVKSTSTDPATSRQLGALDLGSNSFHLLIAQESHGRLQILDKHKEMVRLAEGLKDNGELSGKVVTRALECLQRLAQRLRPLETDNVRIVGTNTLRRVRKSDFIAMAEDVLGHEIEVISGREEARLIYLGVCHDLGIEDQRRLVVDIGGGSTELILGRKSTPEQLESLHMGCVSLSDRFFSDGKVTRQKLQAAIRTARLELEPVANEFTSNGWETCIGASGTINAVHAVIQDLCGSTHITAAHLRQIEEVLLRARHLNRLILPGLADERRSVFPGGFAILCAIFEALKLQTMQISQSALREGLILDLLGRQQEDDTRAHTVRQLIEHYRIDDRHARQVRETALSLLSQVAVSWQLTKSWQRLCLGWSANLHELGMDISHAGYHKHGGYLLEYMDMPGFSKLEQQQVATLVRTHRRRLSLALFPDSATDLIRLAAILRLAVVLNRGRSHLAIPHIGMQARKQNLTLSVPDAWLDEHPLTHEDLRNEADCLAQIGIKLKVESLGQLT